jgi:hypothetical protein
MRCVLGPSALRTASALIGTQALWGNTRGGGHHVAHVFCEDGMWQLAWTRRTRVVLGRVPGHVCRIPNEGPHMIIAHGGAGWHLPCDRCGAGETLTAAIEDWQ